MWLVAFGATISALWILIANSFMHEPVGYALVNGQAVMVDFWALVSNPHVWVQFPHVIAGAITTGAFFVLAISAYHLRRQTPDKLLFRRSFVLATIYGAIGVALVGWSDTAGTAHGADAADEDGRGGGVVGERGPGLAFAVHHRQRGRAARRVRHPHPNLLSLLAYNRLDGEVRGIKDLQVLFEQTYGPATMFPVAHQLLDLPADGGRWVAAGPAGAVGADRCGARALRPLTRLLAALIPAILLPYLANSTGWILTEVGRQPWIVYGCSSPPTPPLRR